MGSLGRRGPNYAGPRGSPETQSGLWVFISGRVVQPRAQMVTALRDGQCLGDCGAVRDMIGAIGGRVRRDGQPAAYSPHA